MTSTFAHSKSRMNELIQDTQDSDIYDLDLDQPESPKLLLPVANATQFQTMESTLRNNTNKPQAP